MSRIKVLLQDCEPDKLARGRVRSMLTEEQWSEILEADARGVSTRTIYAKLSGVITPFFSSPKQFANALIAERTARRKASKQTVKG